MNDTAFILAQWSVQPVDFRIALHHMVELDELFGQLAAIRQQIAFLWRLPIGHLSRLLGTESINWRLASRKLPPLSVYRSVNGSMDERFEQLTCGPLAALTSPRRLLID